MPRGDRTGPEGMGPMTGRAAGYCSDYDAPGYTTSGPPRRFWRAARRGFGRGFAGGFGWRHPRLAGWFWNRGPTAAPAAPRASREDETNWLKARAVELEEALGQIKERLGNLEQE